jgi:hypothetical protein
MYLRINFRGKGHDLHPKKNPKNLDFFVGKSEILGGFYLQKKRVFLHKFF